VWYAAYYLADGRRTLRSTKQKDRQRALAIAHAWEAAEREARSGDLTRDRVTELLNETLNRCGVAPIERISVQGWLDGWLEAKRGKVKPKTLVAYTQAVQLFLSFLGPDGVRRRLESIAERDIEAFMRHLEAEGRSARTVNNLVKACLSAPFERARKLGKIRHNPVQVTDRLPTRDIQPKGTFTLDEVKAILKVADNDWQGAIHFARTTGARLGDVAKLKWSALDRVNRVVSLKEGKTGRLVPKWIHDDFLVWINSQQVVPFNREEPVFPNLASRPLGGVSGLSMTFVRLCDQAGIEKRLLRTGNDGKGRSVRSLTFHSLRHTAASNAFNQSAKETARKVTSHARGGSIDQYLHFDLEGIQAASNLIESAL
jgi:integrase